MHPLKGYRAAMEHADATFEINAWDEHPWDARDGLPKLTRAEVKRTYHGDIEGEGAAIFVMAYRDDGTAAYVGLERIVGRLAGKAGSFVLEGAGDFAGGVATIDWTIVEGSGTGDLRGITGRSHWSAGHLKKYPFALDYTLP
jgi:uncharacterized protein DUF3224